MVFAHGQHLHTRTNIFVTHTCQRSIFAWLYFGRDFWVGFGPEVIGGVEAGRGGLGVAALQIVQELREGPDGIYDRTKSLGYLNCFLGFEASEMHQACTPRRACSMRSCEAVHEDIFAARESVAHELKHRPREGYRALVVLDITPMRRYIETIILNSGTLLVVQGHVVGTINDALDIMPIENLNIARGLHIAYEYGAASGGVAPDRVAWIESLPAIFASDAEGREDLLGLVVEVRIDSSAPSLRGVASGWAQPRER